MQHSKNNIWLIHALMLLTALLIASSFTVSKAIAGGLDPAVLTLLRFALAALLFLPLTIWRHGLYLPDKKQLFGYASISFVLTGFFWLMYLSLRTTTALNTGVIFTLVPSLSGFYSAVLLDERLGRNRLAAMLVAAVGAVWVLFHGSWERLTAFALLYPGDLIFFASCLLMALYTPLVKLFHRDEPMMVMTLWILITGCCWLLLFAGPRLLEVAWRDTALAVWTGTAYLAVFSTMITFFLSQFCTLKIGPTRVMAYSYLYPPFILLIEWLCGHPMPSPKILLGLVLIAAAMLIVQSGEQR